MEQKQVYFSINIPLAMLLTILSVPKEFTFSPAIFLCCTLLSDIVDSLITPWIRATTAHQNSSPGLP